MKKNNKVKFKQTLSHLLEQQYMEVVYRIIGGSFEQEFYCSVLNTIFIEVKYDQKEVKLRLCTLLLCKIISK